MKQVELEQTLKQRVIEVVNLEYKTSVNKFAAALGIRQTTLNDQINGNSKISAAVIIALLSVRPDISAEWLLRGNGDMLISQPQHETLTGEIRNDNETIAALKETIAAQKIAIDALEGQVKVLKGDIVVPHRSAATA